MPTTRVGFIGAGRIARILLHGWKRQGALPSRVALYDAHPEAVGTLVGLGPAIEASPTLEAAAALDVVFLALHPPVIKEVTDRLGAALGAKTILISLAPKFTLEKLSGLLSGFQRIVRVIPNAPSFVGKGFNPLAFSKALSAEDRNRVTDLLAPLGDLPEVDERHLEAYAILTAMGPTYFLPQLNALKSLGESFGLSETAALAACEKMLAGTLALVSGSGLPHDAIMDLIPVKPMAEEVETLTTAYQRKLNGLMEKLRP